MAEAEAAVPVPAEQVQRLRQLTDLQLRFASGVRGEATADGWRAGPTPA